MKIKKKLRSQVEFYRWSEDNQINKFYEAVQGEIHKKKMSNPKSNFSIVKQTL